MEAASLFSGQMLAVLRRALRGGASPSLDILSRLAFQRRQALRRAAAARAGSTVPAVLIASVTRRCNLDCAGCYSKVLRPATAGAAAGGAGELSDDRLVGLIEEAAGLGVGVVMIAGGEPLLRRGLLEKVAAMRGIIVPVFTNGTLLDGELLDLFGRTLVPIFSVEGSEAFTAARRGAGVHELALSRSRSIRDRGGLFGLSVTVTSENCEAVLSDEFRRGVAELGASVLFLVEFVPAASGSDRLVLTDEQRGRLNDPSTDSSFACPVVRLPGDEEAYGGCLAAGRGFAHLSPEGRLEACPFAPYSDSNAAEIGLAAALDSPLMRAIRERHSELTETRGGCALMDKAGWVASLGACAAGAVADRREGRAAATVA
jgi:MoaA/NifB/PqqE/SkfB family radical SAM enzyme